MGYFSPFRFRSLEKRKYLAELAMQDGDNFFISLFLPFLFFPFTYSTSSFPPFHLVNHLLLLFLSSQLPPFCWLLSLLSFPSAFLFLLHLIFLLNLVFLSSSFYISSTFSFYIVIFFSFFVLILFPISSPYTPSASFISAYYFLHFHLFFPVSPNVGLGSEGLSNIIQELGRHTQTSVSGKT